MKTMCRKCGIEYGLHSPEELGHGFVGNPFMEEKNKQKVKLTNQPTITWEKKWDIFMTRFAFQESTVKHFISLLLRETKQQFLENLENARDDDSCECDNCHRTRKFIKEYNK